MATPHPLNYLIDEEHALHDDARPLFHRLILSGIIRDTFLDDLAMHVKQFPEMPIHETEMIKAIIIDYLLHCGNIDSSAIMDDLLFDDRM